MTVYMDLVILLNFLVDFLLLAGTNRLYGYPAAPGRCAAGGLVGGVYGGMCLVPGFGFLGNLFWRIIALAGIGAVTFGIGKNTFRRCVLFVFLSMALGGFSVLSELRGFLEILLSAALLLGFCAFGLRGKLRKGELVPVELEWQGRRRMLMALRDTGNGLTDPLTGSDVLVVGRNVAMALTGLTPEQLANPVDTVSQSALPGLRLIPCKTAGGNGMLLAMRMDRARVDGQDTYGLVAFSPMEIGSKDGFEALTGG